MTTIDTPEGVNMWVLLSRRHQVQMHLKGFTVKGLAACLRREFPGEGHFVKDFVVPIESTIALAGGEADYRLVNVHVMLNAAGLFHDRGIFPNMAAVEAVPALVQAYQRGNLEIVLTSEDVRERNGQMYAPA